MGKRPTILKNPNLLLLLALLLAGGILALALLLGAKSGARVEVRVAGEVTASYSLQKNQTIELEGEGGRNTLVIEGGKAWMSEADCPDGLCLGMGKISSAGQSIVCLPHKLVVEVKSADGSTGQGLDMVAK